MKSFVFLSAAGALAMMICGCNPIVLDPVKTDSHGSDVIGSDDDNDDDDPEPPEEVHLLALRWSQITPFFGTGSIYKPEWIGPPSEPGDLLILFGSREQTCAEPLLQDDYSLPEVCDNEPFEQTILIIPAGLAHPGVVDLGDLSVRIYHGEWLDLGDGGCGGGAFTRLGLPGSLEILSLDASSVAVSLTAGAELSGFVADGEYTASLCP